MNSPKASPTLVINEKVNALWAAGQDVLNLGFGESRFPVHSALACTFQENVLQQNYLPSLGIPELRETKYGLATLCVGVGQGVTTLVERL